MDKINDKSGKRPAFKIRIMSIRFAFIATILATFGLLTGCKQSSEKADGRLKIVATTGMIGDAVINIVGESAEVYVLMGPGVDPHLFKPTPRDVQMLSEADIIVYNGLHLEGKMGEILEKIAEHKKVIELAAGLEKANLILINPEGIAEGTHPVYDPHIWFDVALWSKAIEYLGAKLAELNKNQTSMYLTNTRTYVTKLKELHKVSGEQIASIPASGRVLITAHDAFSYFGKAYSIEVMGLQGISTVAEPGLKDITNLVDLIVSRKIKAVFVESSVSEKAINAVLIGCREKGHEVKIGGVLYSDAMGEKGTAEGTYVGMVKHNVKAIVEGLR